MIDTDFYNVILTMQEEQVRCYKTSFLPITEPCFTPDTLWQNFTSTVTRLPELIRQKTLSEYVESPQLPNIGQLRPDHLAVLKSYWA